MRKLLNNQFEISIISTANIKSSSFKTELSSLFENINVHSHSCFIIPTFQRTHLDLVQVFLTSNYISNLLLNVYVNIRPDWFGD